jgi:hypothetical protein
MPRGTRPTPPAAWRCAANAGRSCRGWRCAGTVVIGNGWLRVARCFRLVQPRSLPEPRAACVAEGPPTHADGASGAGLRHGDGRPASGASIPTPATGRASATWPDGSLHPGGGRLPPGGQAGDRPRLAGRHIPGFRARTPNPLNRLRSSARPPSRAFGRLSTCPAGATSSPGVGLQGQGLCSSPSACTGVNDGHLACTTGMLERRPSSHAVCRVPDGWRAMT